MAIWLDPNNAEAYFNRSEASGGYVADLTEAVRLDPNNNTYKEALRVAQEKQKAAQQSQSAQSYSDSAKAALDKGDYDKAIADYTETIRLEKDGYDRSRRYESRAKAYIAKKDWDNAIADYTELIRRASDVGEYYSGRAQAYLAKGDYDKAIADYTSAVAKYTADVRRNPNAEYYKRDLRNAEEGLKNAQETLLSPGRAALDKKNWDKAIAGFTEAVRLAPNFAGAYSSRAEAYIGKRKYKEARADVDKALQLDPNDQKAKDLDAELKKRRQ